MFEIKILGRGGQGAVSAAYLLASSAFKEGLISQGLPSFGIERRGSPVNAFVRISRKPITRYDHVKSPDALLVLDPTLLSLKPDLEIKKEGVLFVNTNKKPEELRVRKDLTIRTIDATSIALRIFKKPFFNVPVISSFASVSEIISLKSIEEAIEEIWHDKGKEIINLNKMAAGEAYNSLECKKCKVRI